MKAFLVAACLTVACSVLSPIPARAAAVPFDPAYRAALVEWQWAGVWSSDCSLPESARPRLYNVVPGDVTKAPRTAQVGGDHVLRPAFVVGAARHPFTGDLWVSVEEQSPVASVIRDGVWHRDGTHITLESSFVMIKAKLTIPKGTMPFMLSYDVPAGGTASFFVIEHGIEIDGSGKKLGRSPRLFRCSAAGS